MARQVVEMDRRRSAAPAAGPGPLRSGGWGPADITAIIELTRRPPAPQLLLPITTRTGSTPPPLPPAQDDAAGPLAMPVGALRLVPPVLTPPPPEPRASWFADFRRSEAATILGFALAWITTTAAGALSMGHLLAGAQTPIIVHIPEAPAVAESQAPMAACPTAWTPPVVALADLPVAASRSPGSASLRSTGPSRSPDAPAASAPARRLSSSPRRLHASPPAAAVKAKTAPPPKSLEDYMRASVGGSASGS